MCKYHNNWLNDKNSSLHDINYAKFDWVTYFREGKFVENEWLVHEWDVGNENFTSTQGRNHSVGRNDVISGKFWRISKFLKNILVFKIFNRIKEVAETGRITSSNVELDRTSTWFCKNSSNFLNLWPRELPIIVS